MCVKFENLLVVVHCIFNCIVAVAPMYFDSCYCSSCWFPNSGFLIVGLIKAEAKLLCNHTLVQLILFHFISRSTKHEVRFTENNEHSACTVTHNANMHASRDITWKVTMWCCLELCCTCTWSVYVFNRILRHNLH